MVELRRPRWWIAAAVLVLALLALAWGRSWLSERLVPDPRMTQRLEQAQAALAAGKLSAADGSGARELFESVLAVDPDQMQARQGLVDVREAAIARAQASLDAHRPAAAESSLALASALSAPQVQLQPLQARLQELREASADVHRLLLYAAAPGVEEDAALDLYRRVLAVDADNAKAIEGRERLLSARLQRVQALLGQGRLEQAQAIVDAVLAEDPGHLDLPAARAALGEAMAARQARQARELASAAADERRGRLDRAARTYLRLREEDPSLAAASDGLLRLAERMAAQAQRQAEDFRFKRAQASLAKARAWSPQAPGIAAAERNLASSRQAQARLKGPAGPRELERVPGLLAEASQAIERGNLIQPPGASAWDRLRIAAAIAPGSAEVARVDKAFGEAAQRCFTQALGEGRLDRAQACLEARVLQDATAAPDSARRALAERWLAYAQERIGAADWKEAERALANARRWQPRHPGVAATAARLRTARGDAPPR